MACLATASVGMEFALNRENGCANRHRLDRPVNSIWFTETQARLRADSSAVANADFRFGGYLTHFYETHNHSDRTGSDV